MKTLSNLFSKNETKKTIHTFLNTLDVNAMIQIKGGGGDVDAWPPFHNPRP